MPNYTGTCVEVYQKNGIHGLKMDDGNKYGFWKTDVGHCAGKKISFDWTEKGDFKNAKGDTLKVLGDGVSNGAGNSSSSNNSGQYAASSASFRSDTQLAIQHQASRNAAIAFVSACLAAGAVPLPAKKGDQVDAIAGLVDLFTVRYFVATDSVVAAKGMDAELVAGVEEQGGFE